MTQQSSQSHAQAQRITQLLQQAQQACRADLDQLHDPKAQALFETLAEVLGGAIKALTDYQSGTERVWQSPKPAAGTQAPTVSDLAVDVDASSPPPHLVDELTHE